MLTKQVVLFREATRMKAIASSEFGIRHKFYKGRGYKLLPQLILSLTETT